MKMAVGLTLAVLLSLALSRQPSSSVVFSPTAPPCPEPNAVWFDTSTSPPTMKFCSNQQTQTWTAFSGQGGAGVPSGSILFIKTGSCPTGYTEETAIDGRTLIGTVVANANVGTTGGADSITPAGTNGTGTVTPTGTIAWPAGTPTHSGTAATFAGSALGTHAHELPWQIPTTTTIRQIAVGTFGTGTSRAATAVSAAGTANTTSAAVALSQAVSAGTPAGTVTISNQGTIAWPAGVPTFSGSSSTTSAQVFTGTQFDNRSNFVRLIGCRKT